MGMQQNKLLSLAWLLEETLELNADIRSFSLENEMAWSELRVILSHNLSIGNTSRLYKLVYNLSTEQTSKLRLTTVKVLVIGTATFEHIRKELVIAALRHNVLLKLMFADYGQAAQLAYSIDVDVKAFDPDLVFFYDDYRSLENETNTYDGSDRVPVGRLKQVLDFAENYAQKYGATTIFNSIIPPIDSCITDIDATIPHTLTEKINAYNASLVSALQHSDHFLFDLNQLASMVGYWTWCDTNYWLLAKLPFHPDCNGVFAERFASLIAAYRGKSRRVLILDCDNTLWGGVIGDDGIDGIRIGQGSATGEAYIAIQKAALALRERGVVLAVSSKNTHEVALRVFQDHPDMLIREKDVAIFRVNWTDKAANISDIAKALNLGLQSFVFLDDNPAERARVRRALPEVAVPEVGENPADYPAMLIQAGYFNAVSFSEEDTKRADMYASNAQRTEALQSMDDFDDYLASMNMKISFRPFDAIGRPRITQLISKSNQFNLTTHRYTAAEVEEIELGSNKYGLQIRLTDNFGDNGMISVVVVDKQLENWDITLWLMSCRVLGRRVEEQVLAHIVYAGISENATKLTGVYIPTGRNKIVANHYKKLGFTHVKTLDNGETHWALALDKYKAGPLPFEII